MFLVEIDPVKVAPPGFAVTVHGDTGKPLNVIVAVEVAQVGCTIAPNVGAAGITGGALITALPDATDVHPDEANNTVNV